VMERKEMWWTLGITLVVAALIAAGFIFLV
jgi:hypothetical protein